MTTPEPTYLQITCPMCRGTGQITGERPSVTHMSASPGTWTCSNCNGNGVLRQLVPPAKDPT